MFFWRTKATNGPIKKSCYSYRPVKNLRKGTKVRQKTLHNLGSTRVVPQFDPEAGCPQERFEPAGAGCLLEYPKHVEIMTQDSVKRLRVRSLNSVKSTTDPMVAVNINTMDRSDAKSVGCERLSLPALEELQSGRILEELGMTELDTRCALALVSAKMDYCQ